VVMVAGFVGRDSELATLVDLVARSGGRGGPSAAMITGDPGSGKSRLLEETVGRSSVSSRYRVVGYESERQVPLASARDLLTELSLDDNEGPRLRALIEEAPVDHGLEPLRVFEAAHRCLREASPALLVVDDLQWVDDLTIGLLHYLVRAARAEGSFLVLLVATRPDAKAESFMGSVKALLSHDSFVVMTLGPLGRADGVRLAMDLTQKTDHRRAEELWERSGGSPFWLEVLARDPNERPEASRLIATRLSGATSDAATLLAALAVAGRPAAELELTEWLAWSAARTRESLTELITCGLAVPSGTGGTQVAHDLIRAAALVEIPRSLEKRLHVRISKWLEDEARDDVQLLREALEHRQAADLPGLDLAFRLVRSGRRRLLTLDDLKSLASIADESDASEPLVDEIRWEIASAASDLGEPAFALERWTVLLPRIGDPRRRAEASLRASQAAFQLEDERQALAYLDACRAAGVGDPILAIEVHAHAALLTRNSREECAESTHLAMSAARELAAEAGSVDRLEQREREAFLSALRAGFFLAFRTERPGEMLRMADEMVAAAARPTDHLSALLDSALALRVLGRLQEAERRSRKVWLEARRQVLPTLTFHAAHILARTLYDLGRLSEARTLADEAIELTERAGVLDPSWLSGTYVRSLRHEIDVSLLDWREAIDALEALPGAEWDPHFRLHIRMAAAAWSARFGGEESVEEVRSELKAGYKDVLAAGCDRCASEFDVRAAQSYVRIGDMKRAREVLAAWEERHPDPVGQSRLWRDHARALIVYRGSKDRSIELFESVIADTTSMAWRIEEVWARLDLAEAMTTIDRSGAIDLLHDTTTAALEMKASSEAKRAQKMLRALGVRTWRRSSSTSGGGGSPLTPREVEIARLIAEGASNKEVADTLFLSRKTIERHVSNIFTKLGVRNRAELASRVGHDLSLLADRR
jgi:DNA-binding CsgD family transcriptional regulator/tetratricopeptide (TPR) repeat protein